MVWTCWKAGGNFPWVSWAPPAWKVGCGGCVAVGISWKSRGETEAGVLPGSRGAGDTPEGCGAVGSAPGESGLWVGPGKALATQRDKAKVGGKEMAWQGKQLQASVCHPLRAPLGRLISSARTLINLPTPTNVSARGLHTGLQPRSSWKPLSRGWQMKGRRVPLRAAPRAGHGKGSPSALPRPCPSSTDAHALLLTRTGLGVCIQPCPGVLPSHAGKPVGG